MTGPKAGLERAPAPPHRVGWGFISLYTLAYISTSLLFLAPLLVTLALKVNSLVGTDRVGERHLPGPAVHRQPAGHVPRPVRDRRVLHPALRGQPERPPACQGRRAGLVAAGARQHVLRQPAEEPGLRWAFASRFLFVLAYAFLVTYQVYYPLERIGLTAAIVDGLALFVLIIAARSPSRRAGDRAGHPGDRQRQLRVLCAVAGVWAIIGALAILPVKGVR